MNRRFQRVAVLGTTVVALFMFSFDAAQAATRPIARGGNSNRTATHNSSTVRTHFTAEQLRSQIAQWDHVGYEHASTVDLVSRFRSRGVYLMAAEPRGNDYIIHELLTFPTPVGVQVALPSDNIWTQVSVWADSHTGRFTIPANPDMGIPRIDSNDLSHIYVLPR